ncbi:hypothetical protein [Gilliamella apicola]|uniref:hypothetical protein n=1 Tax=Gilliamella apicola TaxID=1196095 RepID=UPI002FEE40FB
MKNKTLNEILTESIDRFSQSDEPQKIIDRAVKSLFTDLINSAFASYGPFGRQIDALIKNALPQNFEKIAALPKYNRLIIDALKNEWNSSGVEKQFIDKATEAMQKILNEEKVPEVVFLSDLLSAFMEENEEQAMEYGWEKPSLIIEKNENFSIYYSNTCHIYFEEQQPNPDSISGSKYQFKNNLAGHLTEKTIEQNGSTYPIYKIYSAKFDGIQMSKLLKHNCTKFESMMIALYFGTSKLALDCQADDIYYPNDYD